MKLSVLANLYHDKTLEEVLAKMKSLGVDTVEIGAGGYPGKTQCDPAVLDAVDKTMPVLSLIILPYTYLWALGWQQIPMEKLIPVLVGLLIMGLGNYLPKCRQNYTSGIKLPWTL